MNNVVIVAIAASIIAVTGMVLATQVLSQPSGFAATVNDVVIMACYSDSEGNPERVHFNILTYSSSENAPVYDPRSDCAHALADLTSSGFVIVDVQPSPVNLAGNTYTLLRTAEN